MGIVSVKEITGGTGSIDEKFVRRYTRKWRVVTDDPTDDPLVATATGLLPSLFSLYVTSHARDVGARLVSYNVERQNFPRVFVVTANYSSERLPFRWSENPGKKAGGEGGTSNRGNDSETNPFARPPDINFGVQTYQEPYQYDVFGVPVANSAGQLFDPAPTRDRTRLTFTIQLNRPLFAPAVPARFHDTVNADDYKVCGFAFGAGTLLCKQITGQTTSEANLYYWRWTFVFHHRPFWATDQFGNTNKGRKVSGWDAFLLDAGLCEKVPSTNELKHIIDRNTATPITQPVPLNGTGFRLAQGADPEYLPFRAYPREDFNDLKLPKTFP